MSNFTIPVLPRKEIVAILAESQIANITENDLLNPTPDIVSSMYTALLMHLDSLQEDHGQMDFAALEQLENPDLHVESVRIINLCNKIKELVALVNCPRKFTLKDLIRPETSRTEVFLSSIINFCLHKDTKMNLLKPIVEDLSLLDEQREELEARISQLNAEIAEFNEAREREIPCVQEVDAKVKDLRQTIQGLNSHQMSLKATFRSKKEKVKEIDEKISSAEFALVQSVQENANLRSKIVQSPDKLQCALEEKKFMRDEARTSERSAMQSFQEKTAMVDVYTKACKKMSKQFAQIQAIQEQVNSAKSVEKDVKGLKAKLSDEGVMDISLEVKLVERQGKAEQLDESRKQAEKEREFKYQEATKELNNVKLEVEAMRRNFEERQMQVGAMVAEVDSLTLKTHSVRESGEAKQQELARKCEEIVKEFHRYSSSIGMLLPTMVAEPRS